MKVCAICSVNEVTSTHPSVDYCRDCYYSGASVERAIASWLTELRTRAPSASIEWLGGGLRCLSLPAGEDRWVWLGWGESGEDALHASDRYPLVGEFMAGCVYQIPGGERFAALTDRVIEDNSPEALARLALDIATEGMMFPADRMEWV